VFGKESTRPLSDTISFKKSCDLIGSRTSCVSFKVRYLDPDHSRVLQHSLCALQNKQFRALHVERRWCASLLHEKLTPALRTDRSLDDLA
jgi:hypothetical protein